MKSFPSGALALALGAAACGCAPMPKIQSSEQAASIAHGIVDPFEDKTEREPIDVADAAADPAALPFDQAVRQALRHSPAVQAALARVRQAQAESQQARLLPNPVLALAVKFPTGSGKADIEASIAADLLSLLLKPGRISAADQRLRRSVAESLVVVLDVLSDVRQQYSKAQALAAQVAIDGARRDTLTELLRLTDARLRGGEATRLDALTLQSQAASLEAELIGRRSEEREARLELAWLIGQPSSAAAWTLDAWSAPAAVSADESALLKAALERRPELQAVVWELAALGQEMKVARFGTFLDGGDAGVAAERSGGSWTIGPAGAIAIPVFDTGQAQRASISARVVEQRHELTRLGRQVVQDVRIALEQWQSSQGRARADRRASDSATERAFEAGDQFIPPRRGRCSCRSIGRAGFAAGTLAAGRPAGADVAGVISPAACDRRCHAGRGAGRGRQSNSHSQHGDIPMKHQRTVRSSLTFAIAIAASQSALGQGHDHDHGTAEAGHEKHAEAHVDEVMLSEAAIRQNNVRIQPAELKSLVSSVVASSRVAFNSEAMAHVGSIVSGRVVELKVRVGDTVKKDDELLIIESSEFGRAQGEFLRLRMESHIAADAVDLVKDAYTRAKALFDESQGIALSEVQKRQAEYRAAVGSAASIKAALQAAENGLRLYGLTPERIEQLVKTGEINPRFEIRAPISGTVIDREVTLGELVSPDKEKLLVLADTTSVWVLADVPEAKLGDIGVGSKAQVQLVAQQGEAIAGEVSLVSSEINALTRTARLRIVILNTHGAIRPGMFAKSLIFSRNATAAAVAVPEEAVLTFEGKASVFVPVAGEANTFTRREITAGRPVNGLIPIHAGLQAGEAVVVSGAFILKAELGKSEAGHEH